MINIKRILLISGLVLLLFNTYSYCENTLYSEPTYIIQFEEMPEEAEDFALNKDSAGFSHNVAVVDSDTARDYFNDRRVISIEPNSVVSLFEIPTDNLYMEQYHTQLLRPQAAWDYETYGNDVRVAVIDSGCTPHTDIKDNLLIGKNYCDTTGNNTDTTDALGHGTHVSGIISAQMNNGGMVGIAPKAKIVPLKCFDSNATTYSSMIIDAIYDAVDEYHCQVINMSFGDPSNDASIKSALLHAYDNNVLLFAAVGNEGTTLKNYPASLEQVIGVGSLSQSLNKSYFSNYNTSVFVSAPGEKVMSLSISGGYTLMSGTSMATPMLSGIGAIAKSMYPDITCDDFSELLKSTCTDLYTSGYDTRTGWGLANVEEMTKAIIERYSIYASPINHGKDSSSVTIYNNTNDSISATGYFSRSDDLHLTKINSQSMFLLGKTKLKYEIPVSSASQSFFLLNDTLTPYTNKRTN